MHPTGFCSSHAGISFTAALLPFASSQGFGAHFSRAANKALSLGYFRNHAALLISCFFRDAISERKKGVKQQLTITWAAFNKLPAKLDIGVYVIRAGLLFVIGLSFSEHYRGIRELTKTQRGINWTAPNN